VKQAQKHIVLLNDKTIIELELADQLFASAFGIGK